MSRVRSPCAICSAIAAGFERGDFLWYGSPYDRDEICGAYDTLSRPGAFGRKFGYQNIMYLAAGQVVAALYG